MLRPDCSHILVPRGRPLSQPVIENLCQAKLAGATVVHRGLAHHACARAFEDVVLVFRGKDFDAPGTEHIFFGRRRKLGGNVG